MNNKEIPIIFMGTPDFAVGILDRLIEEQYNVVAVVTNPDKPQGRGLKLTYSSVKSYILDKGLNIPVLQPVSLKDEGFIKELQSYDAQLFIVVAFKMLPEVIWKMPTLGTFNLHTSLLPQYRGAAPINWAVINGDKESGVTTFMIDKEIDTGAIILQERCTLDERETAGTLHDKLMHIGAGVVTKSIDLIVENKIALQPQGNLITTQEPLKGAPKLNKENTRIDWNTPIETLNCFIRGLSPYPSAHATLVYKDDVIPLKIFDAEPVQAEKLPSLPVGEIVTDGKKTLYVRCANGFLSIKELQLAGKKRLKIHEVLAGFRDIELYHFE